MRAAGPPKARCPRRRLPQKETLFANLDRVFGTANIAIADLNGLKIVNDELGQLAGDTLIRRAAEVLDKAIDDSDVAARLGGDEFALLLRPTTGCTPTRDRAGVRGSFETR